MEKDPRINIIVDSSGCEHDSSDVSETDNFNVGYSDGYSLDILLHIDDYCTDVTVNNDIDAWVLLQGPSLSDDVVQMAQDGNLHNPQHFKPAGEGSRGKRLEPKGGGPTAKLYKKSAVQQQKAKKP